MQIDGVRREDQLLLCCARTSLDEGVRECVAGLLRQDIDWGYFVKLATRHRVIPLVHRSLGGLQFPIPAAVSAELARQNGFIARRNLFLAGKLVELLKILGERQVRAIPYKGLAVAALAYGSITLRQFWDLDILVSAGDYRRTRDLLLSGGGYRLIEEFGWECCLVDGTGTVYVDLHRSISPDVSPGNLGYERLWHRCETPVAGGIRTFRAEDMLVLLGIQLRKDAWETKDLRLSKLCDIAELLRMKPLIDWDEVDREAKRLGCQRALWVGLAAAHSLLGAPVDRAVVSRADAAQVTPLVDYIACRLFPEGASASPLPMSREGFHFRIRERWRDRIYSWYSRPWVRDVVRHLRPSARDQAMVPLPGRLGFLYYLIRPFRVGRDYAKSLFKDP
jgi:hypothetical protein